MTVWIQNPFDNLPLEGFRKQRYWLMAEAFVRAGHDVVYWTSDFSHAAKQRREPPKTIPDGMDVVMVPTAPYSSNVCVRRAASHRAYARTWSRMAAERAGDRPGLIVSSMPTISAAAAALELGRRLGARVAIDVQDAWPETFERLAPNLMRPLARAMLAPLRREARRIYREADFVTGVCDRYRDLTGRDDYIRAYLGIESPASRSAAPPGRAAETRRLVYSGNLGRSYDLATVVKAVEADESLELDVAGFGAFASGCPRVRFHGLLSAERLRALLAECDVGVIPMRDDSWVGIPNKMFDYAAAGLRIVTSLGGETAALVSKYRCGATYRPGDAESLARAVSACAGIGRDASLEMCRREFDAVKIYDGYVGRVTMP